MCLVCVSARIVEQLQKVGSNRSAPYSNHACPFAQLCALLHLDLGHRILCLLVPQARDDVELGLVAFEHPAAFSFCSKEQGSKHWMMTLTFGWAHYSPFLLGAEVWWCDSSLCRRMLREKVKDEWIIQRLLDEQVATTMLRDARTRQVSRRIHVIEPFLRAGLY